MKSKKITPVRLLSLGYIITILFGTLLLVMPFSSKSGEWTKFIDALFVATSATCVTGLIPFDTFTHWTTFGQIVILILIQIGGIGFMTIISLLMMMLRKKISIFNKTVLMQSAGSYNISAITTLIKRILLGTLLFETLGAIILTHEFNKIMPTDQAIFNGIFHSISAFCNAGFDIIGSKTGSLTPFYNNGTILITIMVLIVIGGMGFIVWSDLLETKFRFKKLQLHSKVVIVYNTILVVGGAILFFFFEFTQIGQHTHFEDLLLQEKILNAFFFSISPRTAGFNALDLTKLTASGKFLTILLMFIGGNSGSTAGGIKVTTFIVVIANLISSAKNNDHVVLFKRNVPDKLVKQASSLFLAYLSMVIVSTLIISSIEEFSLEQVLFEVVSAIGTVGLSLGVSSSAGVITKIILILLMYAGRLGALTLFSVFVKEEKSKNLIEPKGKMLVG